MIGAALGMMTGGGGISPSTSSTATSGNAEGGTSGTATGDFNFKSASGASSAGGSVPPLALAAGAFLLALWLLRRK